MNDVIWSIRARCAPVRVVGRGVEPFGEDRAEQVDDVARQPHPNPEARRVLLVEQIGDLHQERADERGQPTCLAGSRVAVSAASRACGRPSMSRGNTSTSIRCGSVNASVYGRSVS